MYKFQKNKNKIHANQLEFGFFLFFYFDFFMTSLLQFGVDL